MGTLIERAYIVIYTIMEKICKEQHQTDMQIESIIREESWPSQHHS